MFHNFCYNKHSFQSKQILKSATVLHFKREIFRPFALRRTHPSEINPILVEKKPTHIFTKIGHLETQLYADQTFDTKLLLLQKTSTQ